MKVSYKQYSFDVTDSRIDKQFDLPSEAKKVTGIRLDSPEETLLSNRGSARIEVSNREIFPENFPAKFIMFGEEVPASERIHLLDEPITAHTIKIRFQDEPSPSSPTTTVYPVTLIVRYETL
ncbi:hypothetical protein [Bernardetia sp. MNP-M8]|uniref:hypothetical protein n=1 Tax=Bernardetia sp. MNP-M8 TaxID=3127470 RepID=UPI0030D5EDB0